MKVSVGLGAEPYLERVVFQGITISLLEANEGTEVIHHLLPMGTPWFIIPDPSWTGLEFLWVLKGRLQVQTGPTVSVLEAGGRVSVHQAEDTFRFDALTDVEFLYVATQPVFHNYSATTSELRELAVSIEEKDGYTADHCSRITRLSTEIAKRLGLTTLEQFKLNIAAYLHDIGKTRIPLEILNKPGSLTDAEWATMRRHVTYGREMLESTRLPSLEAAAPIIEQHHERFDGLGYIGLSGNEVLLPAYIIAVVDSFDAMTTDRPYRKGRSPDEAIQEIQRYSGTMYHPDVVQAFVDVIATLNEPLT